MAKKPIPQKMTREEYEQKIEEMENQAKETEFLSNTIEFRRELLTILSDIKKNTSPVGGNGEPVYLPETPEPEEASEDDF